jgi:NAD+ synthase (glutamine-hydrolysing)
MNVRVALAQINTKLGQVEANLNKHLEYIQAAKDDGADIVVFPELSLTGYVLQDLATTVAIHPGHPTTAFETLLDASKEIDILFGFVEEDQRNRFFISSAYLSAGKILHIHRKVYLPTYGLFDEGRFFAWGDDIKAFDTKFGRFGMLICEDFWHASPPYLLWLDGADVFFLVSSSPGRGITNDGEVGTSRWVDHINRAYASLFTSYVVHSNRVGYEDGLHFWGGASAYDPNGTQIVRANSTDECLVIADLDLNQLHRTRARLPLLRDERTGLVSRCMNEILSQDGKESGR